MGVKADLLLGLLIVIGLTRTSAAEPITFKMRGVIVATTSHVAAVPGASDGQQAYLNVYDGAVVPDGDASFLANARYQIVELIDTGGLINGGYKTFTTSDGTISGRYQVTEENHPNYGGSFTFTGGTGKYAAITGSGRFSALAVSDTALIDTLEGTYEIPPAK